jgi:acetylornithine deacetylase/succinyl-diaminopimelate desuccinylase-like protein
MKAWDYARGRQAEQLSELIEFLQIPSISAQPRFKSRVEEAAEWLRSQLLAAGFPRAEIRPTPGHPVVYAEWLPASPAAPTVLVYGHYDVQPPEPLDLWRTEPFEPTVVGEDLYGRGASDDKGQLFTHIKAVEAYHRTAGAPPVNIKCIFEGEEEIGSPNLDPFIHEHKELLAADVAVISDSHILGKDRPAIVYGLRGLSYIEVEVVGPARDLHSGSYGGAVRNPINALAEMIAGLHDPDGHITVPGFYDRVRPLTPDERAELAKIPFDRQAWLAGAGISRDWGEPEFTIIERTGARPTLDVNGIWGGYTGDGTKTVLPSKAFAKISMRLVPDQEPGEIAGLVQDHLGAIAPPTVAVQVREMSRGNPAIVRRDSPAMQAAFGAYQEAFGQEPVFIREGGSIPVVATLQKELGIETVLMGFGLPDDNLHAPNEKFHLPNFYRGIQTVIHFLGRLA